MKPIPDTAIEQLKQIPIRDIALRCGCQMQESGQSVRIQATWRGGDGFNVALYSDKNTWHDFGGNATILGGDAIALYALLNNPNYDVRNKGDFVDACRKMAADFNINIDTAAPAAPAPAAPETTAAPAGFSVLERGGSKKKNGNRQFVCSYPYYDANGIIYAVCVRYRLIDDNGVITGKDFRQYKALTPDADPSHYYDKTKWGLLNNFNKENPNAKMPLYRLRAIADAAQDKAVILVEGEKDAENLAALGFVVSCFKAIATPANTDFTPLQSRQIYIISDYDKKDRSGKRAGDKYMCEALEELRKVGAVVVKAVYPPNNGKQPFKDISDWIEATAGEPGEKFKRLSDYLLSAQDITPELEAHKAPAAAKTTGTAGTAKDDEPKLTLTPECIANLIVDSYTNEDGLKLIAFVNCDFYIYDRKRHFWQIQNKTEMNTFIAREITFLSKTRLINLLTDDDGKQKKSLISTNFVGNVKLAMQAICQVKNDYGTTSDFWLVKPPFTTPKNIRLLVLENGIFNPDTHELWPHTPRYFNIYPPLDNEYNPDAKAPQIYKFLCEAIPEQDKREILQLACALCLYKINIWQVAFIFVGSGGNGKGIFTKCLTSLLGQVNVTNIGIDRLAEKFDIYGLKDSWLNIAQDMAEISQSKALGNILEGNLKTLIANEAYDFQQKYKEQVTAIPTAKFIFCTNALPYFGDKSNGIWRRLRIIHFKESFIGKEDPMLEFKLREEKAGFLNWVLWGLEKLKTLEGEPFPDTEEGRRIKREQQQECDATGTWLTEHYEPCDAGCVVFSELYDAYDAWYKDEFGKDGVNKRAMKKALKRMFPGVEIERKQHRVNTYDRVNNQSYSGKALIDDYEIRGIQRIINDVTDSIL